MTRKYVDTLVWFLQDNGICQVEGYHYNIHTGETNMPMNDEKTVKYINSVIPKIKKMYKQS